MIWVVGVESMILGMKVELEKKKKNKIYRSSEKNPEIYLPFSLKGPKTWFPEKLGLTLLSLVGGRVPLVVAMPKMASAVLFLARPWGPGHPSHPSWVSLMSPAQVG